MEANRQQNKILQVLPYLFTVLSFLGGFYMSYLSYSYKVDGLLSQMGNLVTSINTLTSKMEDTKERYNSLEKRVSILELKSDLKPASVNIDNQQTHR